jgi:hypothetical protein
MPPSICGSWSDERRVRARAAPEKTARRREYDRTPLTHTDKPVQTDARGTSIAVIHVTTGADGGKAEDRLPVYLSPVGGMNGAGAGGTPE